MSRKDHCNMVEDYLNGALSSRDESLFVGHLKNCSECSEEVAFWNSYNSDLKDAFALHSPPEKFARPTVILKQQRAQNQKLPALLAVAATVLIGATIGLILLSTSANPIKLNQNKSSRVQVIDRRTNTVPVVAKVEFDNQTLALLQNDDDKFTLYRVFPKSTVRSE